MRTTLKPRADLPHAEVAQEFFRGWWHGIAIGLISGAGLAVALLLKGGA